MAQITERTVYSVAGVDCATLREAQQKAAESDLFDAISDGGYIWQYSVLHRTQKVIDALLTYRDELARIDAANAPKPVVCEANFNRDNGEWILTFRFMRERVDLHLARNEKIAAIKLVRACINGCDLVTAKLWVEARQAWWEAQK